MPKLPTFTPIETAKGWMISIPPMMSAIGKRERRFFPEKNLAVKFGQGLRAKFRLGERGSILSHETTMDAARALEILKPHGISLVEAAREVAARIAAAGSSAKFADKHAEFMLAHEEYHRPATQNQMEKIPTWLPGWFMETPCNLITPDAIERAMGDWKLSTKALRKRYVSSVLNYKERYRKAGLPVILTPDEVDRVLAACRSPQETWAVALLLFAGIRPSAEEGEITRIDWGAVGNKEIYIAPEVAKTATDRYIPVTARLARILDGRPKSGGVVPANWKKVYQRIRKEAGIEAQDVLRHTFASNFLAVYGEDKAKEAMGHTANSSTLFRHYRRAVTREDGEAFFK